MEEPSGVKGAGYERIDTKQKESESEESEEESGLPSLVGSDTEDAKSDEEGLAEADEAETQL